MKLNSLLLFILIFCLSYCKKGDTGGEATVTAHVDRDGRPINLPTVYVKFDAKSAPSDPTNNYDLKVEGKHEDHVHIKNLRYGDYYLFAVGFDSLAMKQVTGGHAVHIKWTDRRKETEVDIPVSE